MAALSRDELIGILTDIVKSTRSRLSEARPTDGLKAAEMLAKMCGWNEPERVNVQSIRLKVDAALIEQLRAGYTEISAVGSGRAKLVGTPLNPVLPTPRHLACPRPAKREVPPGSIRRMRLTQQ
jgi:hypothetical protein